MREKERGEGRGEGDERDRNNERETIRYRSTRHQDQTRLEDNETLLESVAQKIPPTGRNSNPMTPAPRGQAPQRQRTPRQPPAMRIRA